jgi:hypothetical protein
MKIIAKRLCRLEGAVASRQSQGPSPAEILRERKRRRSAQLGKPYLEATPIDLTDARGRPLSVSEVLRAGRRHQRITNERRER